MHLDGADLRAKPLIERKAALKDAAEEHRPQRHRALQRAFRDPRLGDARSTPASCNLEGVISKLRDAPYRSGRSDDWIKAKCGQNQEFVDRRLQGCHRISRARSARSCSATTRTASSNYAGRSGTGYTMEDARDLWKKLQPLRRDTPAFGKLPDEERGRKGIWVEPKLVAEVEFTRLHRAGPCAPRGVQGPARGQAADRSRAGDADAEKAKAKSVAAKAPASCQTCRSRKPTRAP